MMPRWQRAFVIATCAVIGGAFAYAACDWGQWPKLTIFPVTGDVGMHDRAGAVEMTYLGIVAWGLGGAATGAIVGAALCAVFRRPWPDRALQLFGAWAITAILLAGSYYTWNVWPW
jgi:hypothetical protein